MESATDVSLTTRRVAGVLLLFGAAQFLIAEAVTAGAWHNPLYDYVHLYISDLGSPVCGPQQGRLVCSPWHGLMNFSLNVQGMTYIVAAVLLFRLVPGRSRYLVLALATAHALGASLVAVFNASSSSALITTWHTLGAAGVILGSQLIAIIVGITVRAAPGWFRIAGVLIGVLGILVGLSLPVIGAHAFPEGGLVERVAIYLVFVFQVLLGVTLLGRSRATGR
ncbi:DUF998 domain-containing protein [Pseudonocardiaceae bacterium YIM PH 21723]|nr:DUF998 domain-containing protein [Pseudonocardiaceae bacterium YIM PH 21723]